MRHWDLRTPSKEYFNELFRVSQRQVIWGMNRFLEHLPNCSMTIIWDKENGENYVSDYELAWCNLGYNRSRIFRMFWISNMIPQNEKPRIHSCQKPIKLYRWILKNYGREGNRILDTHLGSGSSAIAAEQMGFDFVGCEIDKDYYDAACKRFKEQTMQQQLFK